jgi:hypothetical protein
MKRFIQVSIFTVLVLALVIGTFSFAYTGPGIAAEKASIGTSLNSASFYHSATSSVLALANPGGNLPPAFNDPDKDKKYKPNAGWNS